MLNSISVIDQKLESRRSRHGDIDNLLRQARAPARAPAYPPVQPVPPVHYFAGSACFLCLFSPPSSVCHLPLFPVRVLSCLPPNSFIVG